MSFLVRRVSGHRFGRLTQVPVEHLLLGTGGGTGPAEAQVELDVLAPEDGGVNSSPNCNIEELDDVLRAGRDWHGFEMT